MIQVEMYTTATCPYCVAAKAFFKRKGWTSEEIRVDLDIARREEMLTRSSGRRSVPQIFINGVHVGGYDDLVAADRDGRLSAIAETVRE